MSRRRARAELEGAEAAQENSPVVRKSARLAEKPQAKYNFGSRTNKKNKENGEGTSGRGSRSNRNQEQATSRAEVKEEDPDMDTEEKDKVDQGGTSSRAVVKNEDPDMSMQKKDEVDQGRTTSRAVVKNEDPGMDMEEKDEVDQGEHASPAVVMKEDKVMDENQVENKEMDEKEMDKKEVDWEETDGVTLVAQYECALRTLDSDSDMDSEDERENRAKQEKEAEEKLKILKKDAEVGDEHFEPDLVNGICAYMQLLDRIVRVPEPERALFSKEGLELLDLGDKIGHYGELNGVRVGKPEVVLATTLLHCNQLLKLSHTPMFMESVLRWDPIGEKEIAYLIYMLARIKCPLIGPDCFSKTEDLLTKFAPNTEWQPVWKVLNLIRIPNMYMEGTPNGPHFELADWFSENMLPSEGNTYINIIYFLTVFKDRHDSGVLVF